MKRKMTRTEARNLLRESGVPLNMDYHQLRSSQVDKVMAVAKLYGYKKSPSAPGSKARMFYQFIQRS